MAKVEYPLVLGLDLGTTSVKATLVDSEGTVLYDSSEMHETNSPRPGWHEQDPKLWWRKVQDVVRKLINKAEVRKDSISGICVSGQMHGIVLLDSSREVLRPAIIWSDNRSVDQCLQIETEIGTKRLVEISGNRASTGFAAVSFLWVRQNEPDVANSAKTLLFPKDYVKMNLTGSVCTDFSDASGSLLFDIHRRCWSQELVSAAGLEFDVLPEIRSSHEIVGELDRQAAELLGLRPGIVVANGGGDSMVGALGCGVVRQGIWSINIGTGGQVLSPTSKPMIDIEGRVNTFCHVVPDTWVLQGSILSAGLSLRWFRDVLGLEEIEVSRRCGIDVYDLLASEAAKVPPCSDGLLFLPYLIGERTPHNDPSARGVFFGLSLAHGKAHFIRAIMEGVAFALRDCISVIESLGSKPDFLIFRGGGSRSKLWRDILSNVLSRDVVSAVYLNDVSFGSCILAGIASGIWRDFEHGCEKAVRHGEISAPDSHISKTYEAQYRLYSSLYLTLKQQFRHL